MDQSVITNDSNASGVSWAAVIAGAFVAAALSLILLALGTGIGFSTLSPWSNTGASAPTIGAGALVWLVLMQIIASSMGGYRRARPEASGDSSLLARFDRNDDRQSIPLFCIASIPFQ
jgi:hypothetical protein